MVPCDPRHPLKAIRIGPSVVLFSLVVIACETYIMVERLDAPQPTFPLPPLADVPDEDADKADDAKRIVNAHS